ncbi:MAG: hypothetical protein MRZ79_00010 [Bacteroidia bacterium]|nr:hypothetical protein [Bacteroidia bacterium]
MVVLLTIADWIHIYPVLLRSVNYDFVSSFQALTDKPDILMIMLSVHGAMIFFALRGKTSWVVTIALILVAFNLQFWWMDIGPDKGTYFSQWDWIKAGWPGLVMTALHIFLLAFFSDVFLQYREDHDQKTVLARQNDQKRLEIIGLKGCVRELEGDLKKAKAELEGLRHSQEDTAILEEFVQAEIRKRKYDQIKKESHERQIYRLKEQIEKNGLSQEEVWEKRFEIFLRETV